MMRESDQCFTPPHIFKTLGLKFDLDVAAPEGGVPWVPAKRFLTKKEDGLATEWKGRVWMNPPFSSVGPWVSKFMEHSNGIALLPVFESVWFHKLCESSISMVFPAIRITYVKNGYAHKISSPCFFVACGETCVRAISRLGVVRKPEPVK